MAQELLLLLRLQDDATAALSRFNSEVTNTGTSLRSVITTALAVSAAIGGVVAFIGQTTKAYDEQRVAVERLSTILRNSGVSYSSVKGEISSVTEALKNNSNYGVNEQVNALTALTSITHSYSDAIKYLPMALDLAALKGMDLTSAATAIGRALQGNTRMLQQFGINVKDGYDNVPAARAAVDALGASMAGMAEAAQTSSARVKNAWSDLMATMGREAAPATDTVKNTFASLFDAISSGIQEQQKARAVMADPEAFGLTRLQTIQSGYRDLITLYDQVTNAASAAAAVPPGDVGNWASEVYDVAAAYRQVLREAAAAKGQTSYQTSYFLVEGQRIGPSFQGWEGAIPGPTGQPYLATVHGGEIISQPGRGAGGNINVNIYNAGNVVTSQDLMSQLRREVLWLKSRNYNAGLA